MTRSEERELITNALAGDRKAAEGLIKAYQPSLYAYMLRISGRPDVAEDIVQDAFVRALTNLNRFDFKFRFSTWLFTIAKRLYVNAMQKHKPSYDSDSVEAFGAAWASPEAGALVDEARTGATCAVSRALAALPHDQREIVVLFHQLDWPIALISEYLDMPEGTIKSHLHRARKRMRQALEAAGWHERRVEEVLL
jgi:RNA polymerase sigma-70 factor (ECF subfamily)